MSLSYTGTVPLSMATLMNELNAFPHEVSTGILREMRFTSFLDAGCGTNPNLAQYVIDQKRLHYIGVDNGTMKNSNGQNVDTHQVLNFNLHRIFQYHTVKPFHTVKGDVLNLPTEVPMTDVVHMRFVLMHLSPEDAATAITQLLGRTRKKLILLEYDWATMTSTDRYKTHIQNFMEASLKFMKAFKVNPYMGQSLPEITKHLPAVTYTTHQRPEGNYLKELVALCSMQKDRAKQSNMPQTAEKFQALEGLFQYFIEKNTPILFTPPAICAAVISIS